MEQDSLGINPQDLEKLDLESIELDPPVSSHARRQEQAGSDSPTGQVRTAGLSGSQQERDPATTGKENANGAANLDLLLDVPLRVTVELGRTQMPIREVLSLTPGSVVELSKVAGEAVDILVNGKLIAHGEVVVIDDMFGVRVTDIIPPAARVRSLG
ncbi:MAG: hypothetical protein Kow0047_03900 [Anaerolineae bacterium]